VRLLRREGAARNDDAYWGIFHPAFGGTTDTHTSTSLRGSFSATEAISSKTKQQITFFEMEGKW